MGSSIDTHPDTSPPEGITREQLGTDAPALLPLADACPDIHVYTASSTHYATLVKTLNVKTDVFDLAIVRPTNETEVAATVRVCAAAGLTVAIRSGGFDTGERSRTEGGVTIDVRSLDSIELADDGRSVRIGGGVVCGTLVRLLDAHGLDTPVGWGSALGYVGWASAGGYGMQAGSRGLGVDQILGARVVTASGEVVAVADDQGDPDVLWALRGGGGGVVGVVTELTVRVYPRPRIVTGQLAFPEAEAAAVFEQVQALYQEDNDRDKFCGETIIVDPLGNGGMLIFYFWYELDDDDGDGRDLARARALHDRVATFGTVLSDSVVGQDGKLNETTPYGFLRTFDVQVLRPVKQYLRNATMTVPSFSAQLGAIFAAHPHPTPTSAVVMHVCHGVAARRPAAATAFANRTPHLMFSMVGIADWDDAAGRAAADAWVPAIYGALVAAGLPTGWKYANFNPKEKGDGLMYLGAEGVTRMRRVKARWDPECLFAKSTHDLGE